MTPRGFWIRLSACAAGLLTLLVLSPGIGTQSSAVGWWDAWRAKLGVRIDPAELTNRAFADENADGIISVDEAVGFTSTALNIGFRLRFPRTLLALQVGVTLALCGAALQILLRNPLADPYTLGIASGGSLGALLAIRLGWVVSFLGISSVSISAFVGALTVVGAVFVIARGSRRLTSNELLLAGVTLGLFCGAMMMFVTAVSNQQLTFQMIRWMMGTLDPLSAVQQTHMLPMIVPAWIVLIVSARAFNQYRLGDELAASRGVNIALLQAVSVLVTTLATAAVVAKCGPIGFVGLVVPHMVGYAFGHDCRILLPCSAIVGGAFLILCDWASQLSMKFAGWLAGKHLEGSTLPIGVMTAIIGVPLFLVLLRTRKPPS